MEVDEIEALMTAVNIRYFGMLKDIVGRKQEKIEIDSSSSALELVKELSNLHGQKFTDFVFDSQGRLRSGLAFAINGDTLPNSKLSTTKCSDVKEFVILPPISGG